MINIEAIKIKNGYFINVKENEFSFTEVSNYLFNDEKASSTYEKNWFFVKDNIRSVKKKFGPTYINKRFELINSELVSDKIPLIIPFHDLVDECVSIDNDWEFDDEWIGQYKSLESLYELKKDVDTESWRDIEFSFNIIMKLDIEHNNIPFSYPIQHPNSFIANNKNFIQCTEKDIQHQIIDKILWPSILLKEKPSCLSAETSYKIIRKHVQDNIDLNVARIKTDYNNNFTVVKLLNTSKNKVLKNNEIIIFEMKFNDKKNDNFKFIGTSHENLKENIDKYLKDLMENINTPWVECPHCKGLGILK